MKSRIAIFGALCAVLLLGSCLGTPTRKHAIDADLPSENVATVLMDHSIRVTESNGIDVRSWNPKFKNKVRAEIPAGQTELIIDIRAYHTPMFSNTTYSFSDNGITLNHNFQAGQNYIIGVEWRNEGNIIIPNYIVSLKVWEDNSSLRPKQENRVLGSWDIGGKSKS